MGLEGQASCWRRYSLLMLGILVGCRHIGAPFWLLSRLAVVLGGVLMVISLALQALQGEERMGARGRWPAVMLLACCACVAGPLLAPALRLAATGWPSWRRRVVVAALLTVGGPSFLTPCPFIKVTLYRADLR